MAAPNQISPPFLPGNYTHSTGHSHSQQPQRHTIGGSGGIDRGNYRLAKARSLEPSLDPTNLNGHTHHTSNGTNPQELQALPSLLALSQVQEPNTPDHSAQVSWKNNQANHHQQQQQQQMSNRKKTLPLKPLPAAPNKALPSNPAQPRYNHGRQRSKSDHEVFQITPSNVTGLTFSNNQNNNNGMTQTYDMGTIQMHHWQTESKQILFNVPQQPMGPYVHQSQPAYNHMPPTNPQQTKRRSQTVAARPTNMNMNGHMNMYANTGRPHQHQHQQQQQQQPQAQQYQNGHKSKYKVKAKTNHRGRNDQRNLMSITHPNPNGHPPRSKTPDPISRSNQQYNNVITPSQSSNGSQKEIVNRLNKRYSNSASQSQSTAPGIVHFGPQTQRNSTTLPAADRERDEESASDSDSESYSQSQSMSYSQSQSYSQAHNKPQGKTFSFQPPSLSTAADSNRDNKPPPPRTQRKRPESPSYRPEQLQRHRTPGRSKPNKPSKMRSPPPARPVSQSVSVPRKGHHQMPNLAFLQQAGGLSTSAAANAVKKPTLSMSSASEVKPQPIKIRKHNENQNIHTMSKMANAHNSSDNLYAIKRREQLRQKQQQQQVQPDMEDLMAQHEVLSMMHRNGGSNTDLTKRIREQTETPKAMLPATFNRHQHVKKHSMVSGSDMDNSSQRSAPMTPESDDRTIHSSGYHPSPRGQSASPLPPRPQSSRHGTYSPVAPPRPHTRHNTGAFSPPPASSSHTRRVSRPPPPKMSKSHSPQPSLTKAQSAFPASQQPQLENIPSPPFVPPAPPQNNNNNKRVSRSSPKKKRVSKKHSMSRRSKRKLFNDDDESDSPDGSSSDDGNTHFVDYHNVPSHVVMMSQESQGEAMHETISAHLSNINMHSHGMPNNNKHSRGRSQSVGGLVAGSTIGAVMQQHQHAYNYDNAQSPEDDSDAHSEDNDHYSFSSDKEKEDDGHQALQREKLFRRHTEAPPQKTDDGQGRNEMNRNKVKSLRLAMPRDPSPSRSVSASSAGTKDDDDDGVVTEDEDNASLIAAMPGKSGKKRKKKKSSSKRHQPADSMGLEPAKHQRRASDPELNQRKSSVPGTAPVLSLKNIDLQNSAYAKWAQSHNSVLGAGNHNAFDSDNMSVISGTTVVSVGGTKRKKGMFSRFKNAIGMTSKSDAFDEDRPDDISDGSASRPQSTRSAFAGLRTPKWGKKSKKGDEFHAEFPSIDDMDTASVASSRLDLQNHESVLSDGTNVSGINLEDRNEEMPVFDDFHTDIPLTNIEVSEMILGMNGHEWNFDRDAVNVYRAQCATLGHEKFVPKLPQMIYPTIVSSLSLPVRVESMEYTVNVKYNVNKLKLSAIEKQDEVQEEKADTPWQNQSVSTFDLANLAENRFNSNKVQNSILFHHHTIRQKVFDENEEVDDDIHMVKSQDIEMVALEFTFQTTTKQAIKQIWSKICKNAGHELKLKFQLLELDCFLLKICGKEEYLRFTDDLPLVSSHFVRHCLRANETHNLEFVLFYVYDLNTYNERNYVKSLADWYTDNTYHTEIFEYYAKKPLVSDIVESTNRKRKRRGGSNRGSNSFSSKASDDSDAKSNDGDSMIVDKATPGHPADATSNHTNSSLGIIEEDKEEEIILAQKKAKTKEKQIKYEDLGYNCIVQTLISSQEKNKLSQLNLSVEKEVDWLYSTIGSVIEDTVSNNFSKQPPVTHGRNASRSGGGRRRNHNRSLSRNFSLQFTQQQQEQVEIDWENIQQSAVLLEEFEHPIEIKVKNLKNVMNTPRFSKDYDMIVLRIELMFGQNTFEECSWDIRVPQQCLSNSLKVPSAMSTFSTEITELYYSMLPREATWCFTVYGVRENEEVIASEKKDKNTNKVKLKHINHESKSKRRIEHNTSSDALMSVHSEFRSFNKSSRSKKRSGNRKNSPNSPRSPSSPYTPRGGQLKTKAKLSVRGPYGNDYSSDGSADSDNSSKPGNNARKSSSIPSSAISVSAVNHTRDGGGDGDDDDDSFDNMIIDDFSDLFYDPDDEDNKNEEMAAKYSRLQKSKWHSEPLAWCRLPVVDHRHSIRRGSFQLHLWSVPKFNKVKGGPKVDPYSTGFWKKFGTTVDRRLRKHAASRNKKSSKKSATDKMDIILNIEFPHFPFDVVAPLVNPRRPEYIARTIKPYKRKDFPGKQVLDNIIKQDGILPLDDKDKMLVYSNKEKLMRHAEAIPTFLRSVDWLDVELRMEAYDYLDRWSKPQNPEDMIELLRYEFPDTRVRLYAINCLNQLDDYTLNRYLLQLVQALKNELHHNSFLARFLMFRAIRNPLQIGHYLFWHLKSEYHAKGWCERFGLLMEEYLLHLPNNLENIGVHYGKELLYQNNLMRRLELISLRIQYMKKKGIKPSKMKAYLDQELFILNQELGHKNKTLGLPLNPALRVTKLKVEKCKFMSSAKAPLWLVFTNADQYSYLYPPKLDDDDDDDDDSPQNKQKKKNRKKKKKKSKKDMATTLAFFDDHHSRNSVKNRRISHDIQVMYKCGDDLRQDILTLQLITVMDEFWLAKNSDLRMKPYQVIQTGNQCGMVELILSSKTTNEIHTKHGTIRGAFNNKAHLTYLKSNVHNEKELLRLAKENYARSCAGYSVATWVLGIGDRHPSNIMIHKNGTLFHIDFGHFLGNFKSKNVAGFKINRERSPFVFTSMMKYAIDEGKENAQLYREFVQWLFQAYREIRVRFKFFLNLFLLMVPSHMPELIREYDVAYLRNALRLDITDWEQVAFHVESTLKQCLADKYRQIDASIHAQKHAK